MSARDRGGAGRLAALLLALALLPAAVAGARETDPLADARELYERGAMTAAAARARRADGPDGLALAAKATLVEALYLAPAPARQTLLERAVGDARAALALAPQHYGAHLQLAMALGALAEEIGPVAAHLNGYASEGRRLLEQAERLAPAGDPWPDGLLGIWHLRVVYFGGAALAWEVYEASAERGLALCRQTTAEAPRVLALRYGCAVAMLDLDPAALGAEARGELDALVALPPANAAERLIQGAARARLAADAGKAGRDLRSP